MNKAFTYPQGSKWSILEGEDQNKIMFVRRNDSAKQLIGHSKYVYRVGVAVPLLNPAPNGLPTNEEAKDLHSIEDKLIIEIAKNQEALLVLVITTDGMREFAFYSRNADTSRQAISLAQSEHETYKFQFYITKDPEWEIYKEFS